MEEASRISKANSALDDLASDLDGGAKIPCFRQTQIIEGAGKSYSSYSLGAVVNGNSSLAGVLREGHGGRSLFGAVVSKGENATIHDCRSESPFTWERRCVCFGNDEIHSLTGIGINEKGILGNVKAGVG